MTDLFRPAFIHGYDIEITQGQDWPIGFRLMARSEVGVLYLLNTTGFTALMRVRSPDASGAVQVDASTANGRITVGSSPPDVLRSTAYIAGQRVSGAGYLFECRVGGTTSSGPLIFNTTLGSTTVDGTVTWICIGTDASVCNLTVFLEAAYTASLIPWGRGVYSLEVFDTYSHSVFYVDGTAYLRQEASY